MTNLTPRETDLWFQPVVKPGTRISLLWRNKPLLYS